MGGNRSAWTQEWHRLAWHSIASHSAQWKRTLKRQVIFNLGKNVHGENIYISNLNQNISTLHKRIE
ncbi:hypothetical protein NQ318_011332, partial [Aromia moschata]